MPPFHAVNVDAVRIGLDGHADIVIHPRRAQLQLDRDLPVGGLPDFLYLQGQVVRPQPVRMAGRRPLVDAGRQGAHFGDLVGDFLSHEMAAQADLAALPNKKLHSVGQEQVLRVEAVA